MNMIGPLEMTIMIFVGIMVIGLGISFFNSNKPSFSPLAPCPDCSRKISLRASMCPGCGRRCPFRSGKAWIFSVVVAFIIALFIALFVSGGVFFGYQKKKFIMKRQMKEKIIQKFKALKIKKIKLPNKDKQT